MPRADSGYIIFSNNDFNNQHMIFISKDKQLIGEGKLILLENMYFLKKARHFYNFIESKQRVIITARKRSGNFFRSVCQEFCPQGGGLLLGRVCCQGSAWSGGGSLLLGGCLVPGGVPGGDPPGRLLLRAVRILLECILVVTVVTERHRFINSVH